MRTVVLKLRQSIIKDNRPAFGRMAESATLIGIMLACIFAVAPIV
jgi:hypothetical protein